MTDKTTAELRLEARNAALAERMRRNRAAIRAAASKRKERQRRDDTRRLILLGHALQTAHQTGKLTQATLRDWLDTALTRPMDRALFDIPPNAPTTSTAPSTTRKPYP